MTARQDKVSSVLQREISAYILNEDLEGINGLLTITGVDVTSDMEQAKIFFSVIGQGEEEVLQVLKKHIYSIQGMLNRKLKMRKIPRIIFVPDLSGAYAQRIGKIIRKLHLHDKNQRGSQNSISQS